VGRNLHAIHHGRPGVTMLARIAHRVESASRSNLVVSATQMVVYVLKGHDRGAGAPSGPGRVIVPQIAARKLGFSP
jgi:hypothetical protein